MSSLHAFDWRTVNEAAGGRSWSVPLDNSVVYFAEDEQPASTDDTSQSGDSGERKPKKPKTELEPKPTPKPDTKPIPDIEELSQVVKVTSIDFHIQENAVHHKTEKYDRIQGDKEGKSVPSPVVRRGDNFKLTLNLDRPFDEKTHDLRVGFRFGDDPKPTNGTEIEIPVAETLDEELVRPEGWEARLVAKDDKSVTVQVKIPANCAIGEWGVFVNTVCPVKDKDGATVNKSFMYESARKVTILFNPWCKDDTVYMEDNNLLKEYVLNDSSSVYQGSAYYNSAKAWIVGQFEETCLKASLQLLDKGLSFMDRYNPVKVSRHIAKLVNAADDEGVLIGNWSGNYTGGKSPSSWNGSVAILEEYLKTGPVKFAQCWVFSMVTVTVCRALGLPCRGVTNFQSAHDTDSSNTIDKIYRRDYKGELVKMHSGDSIWNFHVWNEVWMQRPDLALGPDDSPGEYDGWQVIDATPQETSMGFYTCGPCSVKAVKKGECRPNYDTGFVFSEVNADVCHWEQLKDKTYKRFKLETDSVGLNISTKYPDGLPYRFWSERRLILDHYKYKEGSKEEEEAVKRAVATAEHKKFKGVYKIDDIEELVKVKLVHPPEVLIGSDLDIDVTLKNNGEKRRNVTKMTLMLKAQTYTGDVGPAFYKQELGPLILGKDETRSVKVSDKDYYQHLIEKAIISIEVQVEVERVSRAEPEQSTLKQHVFHFRKPTIDVKNAEEVTLSTDAEFILSFTNPLSIPLTNCELTVESTVGFENIGNIKLDDIPAKGNFQKTVKIPAMKVGEHAVTFGIESKELIDIQGSANIKIVKAIEVTQPAGSDVAPPAGSDVTSPKGSDVTPPAESNVTPPTGNATQ